MIFCCNPNLKEEVKIIWIKKEAKIAIFAPFSIQIIFPPYFVIAYIIYNLGKIDLYMVLNSCEKLSHVEIKVWTLENGPHPIIGFQAIEIYASRPLMIVKTWLIVQNVRNGHIYRNIMKEHKPQTAYFLRKSPKTDFRPLEMQKSVFRDFLRKAL
jgi:hypothetical protein